MSSTDSTIQETHETSKISAIKDQAIGTVKEAIGNVLGNNKMEVEGKAQKLQGKNDYQHAKASKNETTQNPHGYDPQTYNQQSFPAPAKPEPLAPTAVQGPPAPSHNMTPSGQDPAYNQTVQNQGYNQTAHNQAIPPPPPSHDQAYNQNWNQAVPPPPPPSQDQAYNQNWNQAAPPPPPSQDQAYNQCPPPAPPVQPNNNQFSNEGEPSQMTGWKDQAVGSIKETYGSATGNTNAELEGKAQQMHGKNEAEFAKAQKEGLNEPEHYAKGTKTTEPVPDAKGEVEDQNVSTLGAIKDKAMGSVKEMYGSMTGNQEMELKGKAQNMHGKNEAEFAKAQKQGLSEPEHYAKGTKTTDQAQGQVVGEDPSKMSGWKDQAVGAVKESFGSATNNQAMEIEGKAQKFQGTNECAYADAQKNPTNA